MKPKLFIDTDIILDILAKREPFYNPAAQLFTLIDEEKVEAFTTPVVFSNLFYILSKFKTRNFAHSSLRKLRLLLKIIQVDEKVVDLALNSEFNKNTKDEFAERKKVSHQFTPIRGGWALRVSDKQWIDVMWDKRKGY